MSDDRAEAVLRDYVGPKDFEIATRVIPFEAGYRERQWIRNCVAVGLSGGLPRAARIDRGGADRGRSGDDRRAVPAQRPDRCPGPPLQRADECALRQYRQLPQAPLLPEPAHRAVLARQCRSRPRSPSGSATCSTSGAIVRPTGSTSSSISRSFAFFNYQYILYGMEFRTDLSGSRDDFPNVEGGREDLRAHPHFRRARPAGPARPPRADRGDQRRGGAAGDLNSRKGRAGPHCPWDSAAPPSGRAGYRWREPGRRSRFLAQERRRAALVQPQNAVPPSLFSPFDTSCCEVAT